MRRVRVWSFLLLAASLGSPAPAESVDDVEKKLIEIRAGQNTIRMRSRTDISLDTPGLRSSGTAETTLEVARKGTGHVSRYESKTRSETEVSGSKTRTESARLSVYDGQREWTLTEGGGAKQALVKTPSNDEIVNVFDVAAAFKRQRERYALRLLPDAKVEGRECWVIEASPQKGAAGLGPFAGRVVDYYDKTEGVQRKTVTHNHEGKVQMTTVIYETKINSDIPPERFKFEVPRGVELVELDKSPAQGAGARAAEKP